jgi:hypothetical protein
MRETRTRDQTLLAATGNKPRDADIVRRVYKVEFPNSGRGAEVPAVGQFEDRRQFPRLKLRDKNPPGDLPMMDNR